MNLSDLLTLANIYRYGGKFGPREAELAKIIADGVAGGTGVPTGGSTGQLLAKLSGTDLDTGWIDPPVTTGTANTVAGFNSSGELVSLPGFSINTDTAGLSIGLVQSIENNASKSVHYFNDNLNAIENSPATSYNQFNLQMSIDTDSQGFDFGTGGNAARFLSMNYSHQGLSDIGTLDFVVSNFNLGNGTDPIDVNGIGYAYGFGTFNANVNISGPLQGYGFQPSVNAAASFSSGSYINAFYDNANISADLFDGYTSYQAGPQLASLANNTNYTGINLNPTITTFNGNSGVSMLAIGGNFGVMGANSGWNGVNLNPTIAEARYAAGLNIVMDNVTPYAGLVSSLVFQDLTFTFNDPLDNNSYTMEYTPGATAGSEVVTINGNAIEAQIESGVSTANQIKAAFEANMGFNSAVTITVSGVGSDPQVTAGPTAFSGGANPGTVLAAYLDGDVQITGALSFGGALSVGQLNAFSQQTVVDGGGTPSSIHSLITSPTVAPGVTVANADTIGVNTAALITIGAGATVTTSLLGISALGLPAVLSMDSGSTLDRAAGATFALSLSGTGTGGTVNDVPLCQAIAIPDGLTVVNNLYGYKMDLPFGDPGITTWGVYITPTTANNYFAKNVLIGTPTPSSVSVGVELNATDKAVLLSRMDTTQETALTPENGMIIYNNQTHKFRGYANGSWVDLH